MRAHASLALALRVSVCSHVDVSKCGVIAACTANLKIRGGCPRTQVDRILACARNPHAQSTVHAASTHAYLHQLRGAQLVILEPSLRARVCVRVCASFNSMAECRDSGAGGAASSSRPRIEVVVAATQDGGIGKDCALPWRLPGEMSHFKAVTLACSRSDKCNAVVMGKRTWASIPLKFRPLQHRLNVVLSKSATARVYVQLCTPARACPIFSLSVRLPASFAYSPCPPPRRLLCSDLQLPDDVVHATSLEDAIKQLTTAPLAARVERIFIIGGEASFREVLAHDSTYLADTIHLTRVYTPHECDTFIPIISDDVFALTSMEVRASCRETGQACTAALATPPLAAFAHIPSCSRALWRMA